MPPKGWKKRKDPSPKPKAKPAPEPDPEPEPVVNPDDEDEETEGESDDEPEVRQKPMKPVGGKAQDPEPPEPEEAPDDDEEAKFVTSEDVRKAQYSAAQPPMTDKMPGQAGFITELIAGAGQKLHEVEFGMTGHQVFIHTPADERIWLALGKYAESQLDPTKYGIVILLVVLLGSESMKIAVYAKWRSDEAKKAEGKGKKK